jgi:hypothetical protein
MCVMPQRCCLQSGLVGAELTTAIIDNGCSPHRRYLKKGKYATRVGAGAPVYLAAVLEYLAGEASCPCSYCAASHKAHGRLLQSCS